MKPVQYILPLFAICLMWAGCGRKEDVRPLDKHKAVDVSLKTRYNDTTGQVVLLTHHVVYKDNMMVKEFDHADTLPPLPKMTAEGEDDEGNTTTIMVPKEYEIYVTTK